MSFTLADLERRLASLIRIGKVVQLDTAAARVRVESGGITTTWLPWLTTRAGADATWWAPEPGEQVLLLAPSGELAQAVVLPAIYQAAHPAPTDSQDKHRTQYSDGAALEYDRAAHQYRLDVPAGGSITLAIGDTTLTLEADKATLTTPELVVDASSSTFTGPVNVQGDVTVTGGDVKADAISLKQHKHTEQGDGAPTSPAIP